MCSLISNNLNIDPNQALKTSFTYVSHSKDASSALNYIQSIVAYICFFIMHIKQNRPRKWSFLLARNAQPDSSTFTKQNAA